MNNGIFVGITGASGSIYGLRLVQELLKSGRKVHLAISEWGEHVIAQETEKPLSVWLNLFKQTSDGLMIHSSKDLSAGPASGSFRLEASVIAPCSMASLGAMAQGAGTNLIHRAGSVALKEPWPLIIVPRETPLSLIDLRNMVSLSEAGAVLLPAMPGFYHNPQTLDQVINQVVGKILDQLNIEHQLFKAWK